MPVSRLKGSMQVRRRASLVRKSSFQLLDLKTEALPAGAETRSFGISLVRRSKPMHLHFQPNAGASINLSKHRLTRILSKVGQCLKRRGLIHAEESANARSLCLAPTLTSRDVRKTALSLYQNTVGYSV